MSTPLRLLLALSVLPFVFGCAEQRAERLMLAGEVDKARGMYEQRYAKGARSETVLYGLTVSTVLSGEKKAAARYADECVETYPDSVRCLRAAGLQRTAHGKKDEARGFFEMAYEKAPQDPKVLRALGSFEAEMGNAERAGELLRKAVEVAPRSGDARMDLADLQMRQGSPAEALDTLDEAFRLGFEQRRLEANAWLMRGWAHMILGERALSDEPMDIPGAKTHFAALEAALGRAESLAAEDAQGVRVQAGNLRRKAESLRAQVGAKWDTP